MKGTIRILTERRENDPTVRPGGWVTGLIGTEGIRTYRWRWMSWRRRNLSPPQADGAPVLRKPVFFLSSRDYADLDEPRKCYELKRFRGGKGKEFMLIEIDPPLEAGALVNYPIEQITQAAVTTRHEGASLNDQEWPKYVHFLVPVVPGYSPRTTVETDIGTLCPAYWAELYPTEAAARDKPVSM